MQVHDIRVRRDGEVFVVSAEYRRPLEGCKVDFDKQDITGNWYQPKRIEHCLSKPEDVVTMIGRLLRDGAE